MKPSRFNIVTRSNDDATKYLLYNTFHDHRILFDDPSLNPEIFFEKIRQGSALSPKEEEVLPELKEMGILLDDDVDEQAVFDNWYKDKIKERTDLMQVTILPTMNCNLACDYCFENEVRENGLMKPETTAQTIQFLKKQLLEIRPKKLHITYFGGEPLLHPKPIKEITKEMWNFTQSLGIAMDSGMITNGVLLTPELVDELIPYGFKWVKITFDGDRDEHNKKRIWHSGKGTFDTIYDNLCAIKGKLRVAIGGNFDNENYQSMFGLIDRLNTSPFAADIMLARFKPIMPINADVASQRMGTISSMCEICTYNTAQINGIMSLEEKLWNAGMEGIDRPELGPCEYHSRHSFSIGPDGSFYKCPAFAGLSNLVGGNIADGFNEQWEYQLGTKKWDEHCEECAYLPNCAGGCHFSALNKTGSLEIKNCDYDMLEVSTEAFMQREIKNLSADATQENKTKLSDAA